MLSSLMFLLILKGVSCEELTPVNKEENSLEDTTVTLSYNYSKLSSSDNFFWYRQYPGKPPEFIIYHLGTGTIGNSPISGLKIKVDQNLIHMNISSAAVTDSAVYYCAVTSGGGNLKIFFGEGIKLNIETKDDHPPSFYKLSAGNISACLATDFSRNKAAETKYTFFNKTKAVLVKGDSLYNQVALLSPAEEEICDEDGSDECEESLQPDPKVNLMSLTILVLRLLFFKTVVFNVLMTLRLWISQ